MTNPGASPPKTLSIHGPTPPEQEWSRHLAEWRKSGLLGSEFCRDRRLSYASFRFWKKEIALRERRRAASDSQKHHPSKPKVPLKKSTRQAFIPVMVKPAPLSAPGAIEVLVGGRIVRVPPDFDPDALRRLFGVLEGSR